MVNPIIDYILMTVLPQSLILRAI